MEQQTAIPQSAIPQPIQQPMLQFKDMLIFVLFIALILSILGINIFAGLGNITQNIANILKPLLATLGFATGTVINTTADLTSDTAKFGVDVAEGAVQDIGNLFISASDKNSIPDFKHQYNKYSASLMDKISKSISASPIAASPIASVPISASPVASVPISASPIAASPIASVPIPVPVPISIPTPAKTMDETINTPPPKYLNTISADSSTSNIQTTPVTKKSNWCLIGEYKDRRGCVEIDDADRCISGQIFPSQQACLNPKFFVSGTS